MGDVIVSKGTTTIPTVAGGDNLYFFEGEQTVNANVDHSAIAALGRVYVARRFTGNIQGLTLGVTGQLHYDAGGGSMDIAANDSGTNIIAKVWHTGLGTLTAKTSGTITSWEQRSGAGYIMDTIDVTNVYLHNGSLNQLYKSVANTLVVVGGGIFTTGRSITTGYLTSGSITMRREDTSTTLPTVGDLYITGPAKFNFFGEAATNIYLYHPDARFIWQDSYLGGANMTITSVNGFADAIAASGLPTIAGAGGAITSKSGFTIQATAVNSFAGKPEFYFAGGGGGSSA